MSVIHDQAFEKRLADARRKLRLQDAELTWVEGVDALSGFVTFFLTKKMALHGDTDGPTSRTLCFERPQL